MTEVITTNEKPSPVDLTGQVERPRLLAFLFADYAETTVSGKAVVAGVFDRLFLQPDKATSFYIYVRIAQAAESPIVVTILDPMGNSLGNMILKMPDDAVIKAVPAYMQAAMQIAIPLSEPGLYWFSVMYKGSELGLIPLQVDPVPEESNGTARG